MNGTAMGPSAYTEGEQFQREKRTLFARSWLPFAASGQMPQPGDFVSHGFGGWPLLAIRGEDGAARAFHNVCRHQSMPVVEQPSGSCDALRCRYHGWTYGLRGEFREAPPRVAAAERPEMLGLKPAALLEAGGICFVRVEQGGELPPAIGLASPPFAAAVTTDIDANWKAVVEPMLGEDCWRFLWPAAFIADAEAGCRVLRQIVPRSFLRTRTIDLIFTRDGAAPDGIVAAQRQRAATDKSAAEACHAAHAGGTAPAPTEPVTEFLQQVGVACAEEG